MVGAQTVLRTQPKNLICNFRAPNLSEFERWKQFVQWAKDNGLDVCHLTLSLTDAFLRGIEGGAQVRTGQQVINIQQNNVFQYQVQRPRREPYSLDCVKSEYRRTFSSLLFEAYVLERAREISREFCYRDFLELKHDAFRRIVCRLRRKGKVIGNPRRTIPRFYILSERLNDYGFEPRTTQ